MPNPSTTSLPDLSNIEQSNTPGKAGGLIL